MKIKLLHLITACLILVVSTACGIEKNRTYTITEIGNESLGALPGIRPRTLNNNGTIIGLNYGLQPSTYQNGIFSELPGLEGMAFSGLDINEEGAIVGENLFGHALLYNHGAITTVSDLIDISPYTHSYAFSVNSSLDFVGSLERDFYDTDAFVVENNNLSLITICEGLPMQQVLAVDINDNGTIIGYCVENQFSMAKSFVRYEGVYSLLDFPGIERIVATKINDNDTVVGTFVNESAEFHGFSYNLNTKKFTDIGNIGMISFIDINNVGEVIIMGETDDYIYTEAKGLRSLHPAIEANDWQALWEFTGINDRGEIVGYGANKDGNPKGFLLTPK